MIATFQDENTGYWGINRNGKAVTFGWATEAGAEGYALRNYPGEACITTDDEGHDPVACDPKKG